MLGAVMGHHRGVRGVGCQGCIGAGRDCRYLGI